MIEHGTLNSGLVHQRCCSVPEGVKVEARVEEIELLAVTTEPLREAVSQSTVRSAWL
jgi:hypothetical protein